MKAGTTLAGSTNNASVMSKLAAHTAAMLAKPIPSGMHMTVINEDGSITTATTLRDLPNQYRAVVLEAQRQNLALPPNLKIQIDNSSNSLKPFSFNGKEIDAAGVYHSGTKLIEIRGKATDFFSIPRREVLAHEFGHANHDQLFPGSMKTWTTKQQEDWADKIARQLTG